MFKMFLRPNILSVLELCRDIIRDEFTEKSFSERKYETLMMANAINIAYRQVAIDKKTIYNLINELSEIDTPEKTRKEIPNLLHDKVIRKLCSNIRDGKFDPGTPDFKAVLRILIQIVSLQLDIYSPKYKK